MNASHAAMGPAGVSTPDATDLSSAERAALLERATASLAHAVANAVNVVAGRAHMLQMAAPSDAVLHSTKEMLTRIEALTRAMEQVRHFAESARSKQVTRRLGDELTVVDAELRTTARQNGVALVCDAQADASADFDVPADALRVMLRGVLGFAVKRAPRGSTVSVRLEAREVARHHKPVSVAALSLELPAEASVPETQRGVLEPWLEGAIADADERLLLATGVGAAHDRGGWYELEPSVSGVRLSVFLRAVGER